MAHGLKEFQGSPLFNDLFHSSVLERRYDIETIDTEGILAERARTMETAIQGVEE